MFGGKPKRSLASFKQVFEERSGTLIATTNLQGVTEEEYAKIALEYFERYQYNLVLLDKQKCLTIIPDTLKKGIGIIIKKDNAIIGMLLAEEISSPVAVGRILQQTFFNCNVTGMAAARAVMLSHRVLVAYAKAQGFNYVASNGSNKDPLNHFNKLLEIDGWLTEHYMSVWRLNKKEI